MRYKSGTIAPKGQLRSVISDCGTCSSLARELSDDIISLRPLQYTSKDDYIFEKEITVDQREIEAAVLDRHACAAKVDHLHTMLNRCCNPCIHVA